MIISFEIDEKTNQKLLSAAREDGHTNKSAVVRKAITLFFDTKKQENVTNRQDCSNKEE